MNGSFYKYRPVTHCIFDLDGLILDTETLAFQVTQNILNRFSNPPKIHTWAVKESLLGLQADDVAKKIVNTYDLPITWQEYKEIAKTEAKILMQNCQVCDGADRLIRHLFNNKIPICIATSSSREAFMVKTMNHKELFKKFNHIVMGASDCEVKNGKPAPDIFLIAAKRFDDCPKNENCLVFEDSPSGVQAALSAGMQVVAVPDHRISKTKVKNATVILKSLNCFRPEEFGLPPFDEE
ncbi:hypothetical protein PVAND_016437 [Polypedilum vanderplanki]|uniref:Uncharacterized protein n=1 Tax=Polypedilum vanderplanki TaxID=319348 RepID=A0A9J6BFL2_POLVA|nr:hypothetical protein PVAND_016437 [Polypedilum vanderplanki]